MAIDRLIPTVPPANTTMQYFAEQVQEELTPIWQKIIMPLAASGTGNVITATAVPALTAYTDCNFFAFTVPATNTGAVTLNIDGLGPRGLFNRDGNALGAGDLPAGRSVLVYNDPVLGQMRLISIEDQQIIHATVLEILNGGSAVSLIDPAGLYAASTDVGGPAFAGYYLRLDANGAFDASLLSMATAADVLAGTSTTLVNNPAALAGATSNVSGSAGYYITADALGKLDPSFNTTATSAEVRTGADTTKVVTSAGIAGTSANASTGAANAGYWVRADGNGKVSDSFIYHANLAELLAGVITNKLLDPATMVAASINASAGAGSAGYWVRANANGKVDDTFLTHASSAEVLAGAINNKVIDPNILAASATTSSAGLADAGKYVRLNAAGGLDASLISEATSAEIIAGTVAGKVVTPVELAGASTDASAGAADAGKHLLLNVNGLVDYTNLAYAVAADVLTGTDVGKIIDSATLAGAATVVSAGAADAGKYVRLDANGMIDTTVLNTDAMELIGLMDVINTAPPAAPNKGDMYISSLAGTVPATWPGMVGKLTSYGDLIVYTGTQWNLVQSTVPANAYVPVAGTAGLTNAAFDAGAKVTFDPAVSGDVVIEGSKIAGTYGAVDRIILDAGTY